MPERSWKELTFWWCVSFGIIAGLSLGGFLCSLVKSERAAEPTVHVVIHYEPIQTTHLEQWAGEVAVSELKGKRGQLGALSPETERAEHWRMIRELQRDQTNQNVQDGPPGLDAPWKRKR